MFLRLCGIRLYGVRSVATLLWPAILFPQTAIHFDQTANFANYRTYSWATAGPPDHFWSDEFKAAADRRLAAKGWQRVDSSADVRMLGSSRTSTQPEFLGRERTIERADGAIVTLPPQVEFKGKVTLFIDVYNAQLTKVIWQGSFTETLSGNKSKNEKRLSRALGKLLQRFPPSSAAEGSASKH